MASCRHFLATSALGAAASPGAVDASPTMHVIAKSERTPCMALYSSWMHTAGTMRASNAFKNRDKALDQHEGTPKMLAQFQVRTTCRCWRSCSIGLAMITKVGGRSQGRLRKGTPLSRG